MQQPVEYIRRELNDFYSRQEIAVLTHLVLKDVCNASFADITVGKISNLSDSQAKKTKDILQRLKNREPIQYILGYTEFYGQELIVAQDVLIPRPETEELVEWVLSENRLQTPVILDIGTGSGCIAVVLAKKLPGAQVHAWDVSEKALAIAAGNAGRAGVSVRFSRTDVLLPVFEETRFDILVSNPPYVMESEKRHMERNVLGFEPPVALFVPDDQPLLFYERIADIALEQLKENGRLYVEINRAKGREIEKMFTAKGFINVELRKDMSGNERMIRAEKHL